MQTVNDMGEGGVKNDGKSADILYGWSLCTLIWCIFLLLDLYSFNDRLLVINLFQVNLSKLNTRHL